MAALKKITKLGNSNEYASIYRDIIAPLIVPLIVVEQSNSGNTTNAALALKRALIIASLGHTMSIAQCKGIYPA